MLPLGTVVQLWDALGTALWSGQKAGCIHSSAMHWGGEDEASVFLPANMFGDFP